MNYIEGINYMKNLCKNGKGVLSPEDSYPELKIHYPGYKKHGDYRMEIEGNNYVPKHTDVCICLYNMLKKNQCDFVELKKLLIDIYENGTNVCAENYKIPKVKKIVSIIYWITLQDEINYPQPKYKGRRMPFSRYFEAILCTQKEYEYFTLENVLERCNNRGTIPTLYNITDAPNFYY